MQTKIEEFSIFSGKLKFTGTVPADAETWDEFAGEVGDCLETAKQQHTPRGFYGPCRSAVVAALEKAGHKRKVTGTKKNAKGDADVDVLETPDVFVQRLLAENAISEDAFVALGLDAVSTVSYAETLKGSTRTGGGRLSNAVLNKADEYISWWQAGQKPDGTPTSVEKSLAIMQKWLPTASLTDPYDREEVAKLLRDVEQARAREAMA